MPPTGDQIHHAQQQQQKLSHHVVLQHQGVPGNYAVVSSQAPMLHANKQSPGQPHVQLQPAPFKQLPPNHAPSSAPHAQLIHQPHTPFGVIAQGHSSLGQPPSNRVPIQHVQLQHPLPPQMMQTGLSIGLSNGLPAGLSTGLSTVLKPLGSVMTQNEQTIMGQSSGAQNPPHAQVARQPPVPQTVNGVLLARAEQQAPGVMQRVTQFGIVPQAGAVGSGNAVTVPQPMMGQLGGGFGQALGCTSAGVSGSTGGGGSTGGSGSTGVQGSTVQQHFALAQQHGQTAGLQPAVQCVPGLGQGSVAGGAPGQVRTLTNVGQPQMFREQGQNPTSQQPQFAVAIQQGLVQQGLVQQGLVQQLPGQQLGFGTQQQYVQVTQQVPELPDGASRTVCITDGLPNDITVREVAHIFRQMHGYQETRLTSRKSKFSIEGQSQIIGFVEFESALQALAAINQLRNYNLDEQQVGRYVLALSFARERGNKEGNGFDKRREHQRKESNKRPKIN